MAKLLRQLHVLVLEDDHLNSELFRCILEDHGAEVTQVFDVAAALLVLESTRPSLAIVDYWLQGGVDSGAVLRALDDGNTPFVIASGSMPGTVPATQQGQWPVLLKPFRSEQLLEAIRAALDIAAGRAIDAEKVG